MSFQFFDYHEATKDTGGKIVTPGAYLNVPMAAYHGQPCDGFSVSSSGLRTIYNQSLKHFWNGSTLNPEREDIEQTEFIVLGRAAHHLLLGEADFNSYFKVRPTSYVNEKGETKPWSGNATVCKTWQAERALEGLTVLKPEQVEQVKGMAKSLSEEPIVQGGILNGYIEVSMFWKDAKTGIWLKSRPDVIPNASGDVADLKCVSDVSNDGISKSLGERGYNQQAALVREGMQEVLNLEMQHFTLVYVEQKKPNCVRFDEVDPLDIVGGDDAFTGERVIGGHEENHAALRLLKRALDTDYWPGPKAAAGDGALVRRTKWHREQSRRRLETINQELAA